MIRRLPFLWLLVITALILTVAIFFISATSAEAKGLPDIASAWLAVSDTQRSSLSLTEVDNSFRPFHDKRLRLSDRYAYLWLRIKNTESEAHDLIIINESYNYYVELLKPDRLGAVTLYRQGDRVPVSDSPLDYHRAALPITIPPKAELNVIIEYSGPRGIVIDPEILTEEEFLRRLIWERTHSSLVYGVIIALLLLNLLIGAATNDRLSSRLAVLVASVFLFSLRQSRLLLLLIDPLVYPEWLFPLSVALNLAAGIFFGYEATRDYLRVWAVRALKAGLAGAAFFSFLSFFFKPYVMADLLNLLSVLMVLLFIFASFRALRSGDKRLSSIIAAFIPWLIFMIADVVSSIFGLRLGGNAEYRQLYGLAATFFLVTVVVGREAVIASLGISADKSGALDQKAFEDIKKNMLLEFGHSLRQPINTIIALAAILRRDFADPRIIAASQTIDDEARALKDWVLKHIDAAALADKSSVSSHLSADRLDSLTALEDVRNTAPLVKLDAPPDPYARVWIFDGQAEKAAMKRLYLEAEGFSVKSSNDMFAIAEAAAKDEIDILIIDLFALGDQAYRLCSFIRAERNPLELPILMITSHDAQYAMKKGFGVGINDFLTTPYDPAELAARVGSLAKLKRIAEHNLRLSRSEKEKNAFLYFLTHDVNTPLTVALNRVRELEGRVFDGETALAIDDLCASTRQISEIVQNVLVTFRLADGRHTMRLMEIEIENVFRAIEGELRAKSNAKEQKLLVTVPEKISAVEADYSALRSILYNLLDNAIKFTPRGGDVSVVVTDGAFVTIEIRDTGPGISASERPKMFGRFEKLSARPTGGESSTGLGLFVALELTKLNGGKLEYVEKSKGACFVLSLPAYHDEGS